MSGRPVPICQSQQPYSPSSPSHSVLLTLPQPPESTLSGFRLPRSCLLSCIALYLPAGFPVILSPPVLLTTAPDVSLLTATPTSGASPRPVVKARSSEMLQGRACGSQDWLCLQHESRPPGHTPAPDPLRVPPMPNSNMPPNLDPGSLCPGSALGPGEATWSITVVRREAGARRQPAAQGQIPVPKPKAVWSWAWLLTSLISIVSSVRWCNSA